MVDVLVARGESMKKMGGLLWWYGPVAAYVSDDEEEEGVVRAGGYQMIEAVPRSPVLRLKDKGKLLELRGAEGRAYTLK